MERFYVIDSLLLSVDKERKSSYDINFPKNTAC